MDEIIQSIIDQVMISFQSLIQPESRSHYHHIYILSSLLPHHAHRFIHRLKCVPPQLISPLLSIIIHSFPMLMRGNLISSSSSSSLSSITFSLYSPLLHSIATTPSLAHSLLLPLLAVTEQHIYPSLLLDFQKHIPQLLLQAFIIQDDVKAAVNSLFLQLYRVLDRNQGDSWNDEIRQEFWQLVRDGREREAMHEVFTPIDQIVLQSVRENFDFPQVFFIFLMSSSYSNSMFYLITRWFLSSIQFSSLLERMVLISLPVCFPFHLFQLPLETYDN